MNGFLTTNGQVRSSAIYRTFQYYRINKLIFIKPNLPGPSDFPLKLTLMSAVRKPHLP